MIIYFCVDYLGILNKVIWEQNIWLVKMINQ